MKHLKSFQTTSSINGLICIATSKVGNIIAYGRLQRDVEIFDNDRNTVRGLMTTVFNQDDIIHSMDFNSDATILAALKGFASAGDQHATFYNAATGAFIKIVSPTGLFMAREIKFSLNDQFLGILSNQNITVCGDNESFTTLSAERNKFESFSFSPDGTWLASASFASTSAETKTILIWRTKTFTCVKTLQCDGFFGMSVCYSPNGKLLAVSCSDRKIRIYETKNWQIIGVIIQHQYGCNLTFSPDGSLIVEGSSDSFIYLWNSKTFTLVTKFKAHFDSVTDIRWLGNKLLSSSSNNGLKLWEILDCKLLVRLGALFLKKKVATYVINNVLNFILAAESQNSFSKQSNYFHFKKMQILYKLAKKIK